MLLILIIVSGTYAFWLWRGEVSEVNVTTGIPFNCSADGGIHDTTVGLMPASCTHSRYAIQREITINHQLFSENAIIALDMLLKVDQIGDGLSESSNFKYAVTKSPDSCTTDVLTTGTFQNTTEGTTITIVDDEMFAYTGAESINKYYLYVWIDPAEENSDILNQTFSFSLDLICNQFPNQSGNLLYDVVSTGAVMDNTKSEFVSASTGINFAYKASDTNGKGVYTHAATKNNAFPIHYYRGEVDNNNIIFANFCWKMVSAQVPDLILK